ncbi:MAG: transglutaminase domain-containing protein [Candidatus Competibacteraceae bacterium]|nr:transglutaminase domain-containing protein [Candidatus Competibacteraceae bacterium]
MANSNPTPKNPRFPTNPNPAPIPGKVTVPARPTKPDVLKPGFTSVRGPAMAPDAARKIIESRQLPGKVHKPAPKGNNVLSLMGGAATNTVQGPNSIVELARALRNDPQLIYEFVANNIEFLPTYGLQKGGLGAVIDGFGNAFDQADLMVQLLTEAGFTARYISGEIRLYEADWMAWLGTDNDVWSAVNLLGNGGIPCTPTWDSVNFLWYIDVSHVWVRVTISSTDYYFDPAMKSYTNTTGVNLGTATGYNQTTFLSDAASGATLTADYAEDWNIANINDNLSDYTMNLVDWIRTNMPGAKVEDIVGGRAINKVTLPVLNTSLSYVTPGTTPTVWTAVRTPTK